ncbi:UDP-GlcNAc:undecaprenyl-phosphate GlcNAc-1-phosphate transferase [Kineococcus xinjiangensis]|uniref:UDP-GlcNAc:undecaprenyl-phosphate GlcNAc-1-phosphate transferase n=1 Tax=Kineococcus xinjiangensis TaxID=512762 RepID=A0A2S6IWK5_9ACTN|nr:MraY family glycosyltransferase [Kineococcus xinjiangensis]PPK98666.1 UDP-GlcNAc:undecaprenyl-phosphate GlcNAc-1-phosphate transferase [Kineococcus xinjiangensis]
MRAYLLVLIVAAAVTYLTTPLVRRCAQRVGAMTPVRDRDVHAVPIPRMGGVAMLLGLGAAFLVASRTPFLARVFEAESGPLWVLVGATIVCAVGVVDDIVQLDAVTKLAGQVLAAGVMGWQGIRLLSLPVGGVTLLSSQTMLLLTVLGVVVTINAVNFVDGLDGLAAGIVGIGAVAFFGYSYALQRQGPPDDYSSLATLVAAATVGCCLGFLPHNFNPARVFMGDSGSMLLGLLLASSTIAATSTVDPELVSSQRIAPAFFPLVLPIAVLLVPLGDMLLAVVRRTRAGRAFWHPDKQHLHHRLLELGHSHRVAVLVMYSWAAALSFGVSASAFLPLSTALLVALGAALVVLALTFLPLWWRSPEARGSAAGSGATRVATAAGVAASGPQRTAPGESASTQGGAPQVAERRSPTP